MTKYNPRPKGRRFESSLCTLYIVELVEKKLAIELIISGEIKDFSY